VRCSNEPLESSGWTRTESPGFRVYQVVIVQDYLRYQFTDHHRVCGTDRLPRDANPFGAFNIKYRSLIDKQKQSRQKGKAGKLYCCFVDFRKAFDTVPHAVLWQVLEELGVHGRILDIIKSLYAHDGAAVWSSQGISAIFRCLMGVKQGCPLSPTLFGLYVELMHLKSWELWCRCFCMLMTSF